MDDISKQMPLCIDSLKNMLNGMIRNFRLKLLTYFLDNLNLEAQPKF
jgi:hypothetical protein